MVLIWQQRHPMLGAETQSATALLLHSRPPEATVNSQYDPAYYPQRRVMSPALFAALTKPFHQGLLDEAKASLTQGQNEMAVVLAQAASEQCTEWAMAACFDNRGCKDLTGPVFALFRSLDICNERVTCLYSALTGDSPQNEPFWTPLDDHAKRRNQVVHQGKEVTAAEAGASVTAVEQYVLHAEEAVAAAQTKRSHNP